MKFVLKSLVLKLLVFSVPIAYSQMPKGGAESLAEAGWKSWVYKDIGDAELLLWSLGSDTNGAGEAQPGIVFFYGGGWQGGTIAHFKRQGEHLASRGMVAMLADYRQKRKYGGTPFDCVADAKSTIRFIRANAVELGVDPNRLAAGGGSAGGHLAAATATLPGLNDAADDLTVSCIPNALALFNPVYDNGPLGYGFERIGDRYLEISPLHNLRKGMPPTIVFMGTEDVYVPVTTAKRFDAEIEGLGGRCDTHFYEGAEHGFFNQDPSFTDTLQKLDAFFVSLNYIEE